MRLKSFAFSMLLNCCKDDALPPRVVNPTGEGDHRRGRLHEHVAGAPERGASQGRSGTDCPSGASRQRLRQYRTVFGHASSSGALSRTPMLWAACKIMRAATPTVV